MMLSTGYIMNQIRAIREKHKLNQCEFAKKLGLSQSYISKLETGESVPNVKCLIALQNVFKANAYLIMKSYYSDWE